VNLQVFSFVKLTELYYAGSHGLDIAGPVRAPPANGCADHSVGAGKVRRLLSSLEDCLL
jgi:hypothetical protein